MNEPLNKFETELASLRPRALPPRVAARIAEQLDELPRRMSFADRVLASFMGAGALAACVIVALFVWQVSELSYSPSSVPPPRMSAYGSPSVAQYQQMLARSSDALSELSR